MCRGHVNEQLHTTFRNSGRVAGTGILSDRYDEESGNPDYEKQHSLVRFPSDSLTEEELLALNGPVICKKGWVADDSASSELLQPAPDCDAQLRGSGEYLQILHTRKENTMNDVKELPCACCIHKEICSFKDIFRSAQEAADQLAIYRANDKDGGVSSQKVSGLGYIKPVELECEQYIPAAWLANKKGGYSDGTAQV